MEEIKPMIAGRFTIKEGYHFIIKHTKHSLGYACSVQLYRFELHCYLVTADHLSPCEI